MNGPVRMAVILAAGMGTRLGNGAGRGPKGFLELGGRPIIEQTLDRLSRAGIEQVIVITGHRAEWYETMARHHNGFVTTVHNRKYQTSGSMYSLYCARDLIDRDFLLLESDLVFEQRALSLVQSCEHRDCILLSSLTCSHDEVFVETDGGNLAAMSKDRRCLSSVDGELVGITKISVDLFSRMSRIAADAFAASLMFDYETDCLVAAARDYPLHCHPAADLAWAEIDDLAHLERARSIIYPEILRREASSP